MSTIADSLSRLCILNYKLFTQVVLIKVGIFESILNFNGTFEILIFRIKVSHLFERVIYISLQKQSARKKISRSWDTVQR